MVGDTVTDMKFAKNAAITSVCVGSKENARGMADYTFQNAGEFLDFILQGE